VVPQGDCGLRVEWDPATGGSGGIVYDLYRHTSTPVPLAPAHLVASGLTDASYLDGVAWGSDYAYRVVARDSCAVPGPQAEPNGGGDSLLQAPVDTTPPLFDGVTEVGEASPCSMVVQWDETTAVDRCSGLSHYSIYRDSGTAHAGGTLAGGATSPPWEDTPPGSGVWTYVVRAVNGAGIEEGNEVFLEQEATSCLWPFPRDAGGSRTAAGPGSADIRISWEGSPDEGGLYPVTYAVLRGSLEDLESDGYTYTLVDPAACGITENEYIMESQVDDFSYYYVIVPVSGENATFGFDSRGVERPEAPVCP